MTTLDLTNRRYGWLTVLRRAGCNTHGAALWRCRCGCGTECDVTTGGLNAGGYTSCGCRKRLNRVRHRLATRRMFEPQCSDDYVGGTP